MYRGEESGYNVSYISVPTMTRANLEAVVNACLMEDTQLLFKTDTEIVEAIYARLRMQEVISVQQGLHSAKRDTLLQSKKDVVGELGEYNLSSLFKGANMQDPIVIPHEVCMPMHEQTLVSESFKTGAVDLIQEEEDISNSVLLGGEEACKLPKLEDSRDDETPYSKGIPQVPFHMCEELQESMFLAESKIADFEHSQQDEDAIISAFLSGCIVLYMTWIVWVTFLMRVLIQGTCKDNLCITKMGQ